MFFLVRVRVDVTKLVEFGTKVANREFDNSSTRWTYCLKDDPTVGFSIWETEDEAELEKKLGPYRPYYKEIQISRVVLPTEAQALIIKALAR